MMNVIRREWQRMTTRRLYFGVCIVLPLFSLFFMATIFGNGQMENIPIAIVDQDNTATSRTISRNISAVPTFQVTHRYTDEAAARQAVQRKEIYGYLVIPPRFEQASITGTDATLSYYYHYALLSVGSELMAAFGNALVPIALSPIVLEAVALGVKQQQIITFLLPVQASIHPLYNPDMDYSVYLTQPFFFVLFQILILLVTVYSIGSELKFFTARAWLQSSLSAGKSPSDWKDANMLVAVAGKLLPYTLIFSLIGILANFVFFGVMHIPFQGSLLLMNLMTVLFILSTQALAVFLFALFPRMAYVISIVSMIGSLGATLSGVTFPVTSMYSPIHAVSCLFPIRHFMEMSQAMLYFNAGFGYFWQSAAILCLFPLAALLLLPRLKRWIGTQEAIAATAYTDACHEMDRDKENVSFASVMFREGHNISSNPAILFVLLGGIFVYGLLYNYMYAPNVVRKTPVAVVDYSHSVLSREYIRLLTSTPQSSVHIQTSNYQEAKELIKQREVGGILYLPSDFDTRVGRGEESVFVLYAATDAFLCYKNLQEASSRVMLAVNDVHRTEGGVFLPPQGKLAVASSAAINVSGTALYNYTGGYGSYLIPAVLIIILFQTLLMIISMLSGEENEKGAYKKLRMLGCTSWKITVRLVIGKTGVYVMLYAVFSLFLLGLLPHFFSIPHIGNGLVICVMMIPFLIGTSFLGLAASRYFTDSEAPVLMIAFFSVGYIFLSGVSYPLELMPWYWQAAHYLFPAAPAVLAFVQLNSMGSSLADIQPELITLWIQAIVYGVLSLWVFKRKISAA